MKTTTQMKEAMDLLQKTKTRMRVFAAVLTARQPMSQSMIELADRIHAFQRRWSKSRKQPQ